MEKGSLHNDLPWQLLTLFNNQLQKPEADLNTLLKTHTNIPKLKAGFVGGQFWSAYMPCDTQNKDAVKRILEQIDVIHRMCQLYPETFMYILQAFEKGRVASLIGVEGGHLIDSSLGVLRTLHHLGMRYLTLTHNCNTPWADNWLVDKGDDKAESQGLSSFGKRVLNEMNRLGVMVDLSHVAVATMKDALQHSKAPVIFSHSSAYRVCPSRRNVPDDVLQLVVRNREGKGTPLPPGGSSLTFTPTTPLRAEEHKQSGDGELLQRVCVLLKQCHLVPSDHLDHIKNVAGPGAVGLGGDYDGVTRLPVGLEDVSKYPDLIAELLRRNWTEAEVRGVLSDNLLRVFSAVEQSASSVTPGGPEPPSSSAL
ncbi:Dipeptidase 1 [Apodemus speciosus]|uniref:Dipeptidase n=1 Tax=Apodemus speciosus TaxID=105296 RepID=A0ABQ0F3C3_APOSI